MIDRIKTMMVRLFMKFGFEKIPKNAPLVQFHSDHYLRHNARRLEHLASLRIPVAGMTVLEVGAGIGDHSHYYIDRGCKMKITEGRLENLNHLKKRYPNQDVQFLDMENPSSLADAPFDVIHCYGLLYHLKNPEQALEFLRSQCRKMLFLETCVAFGDQKAINLVPEDAHEPVTALSGFGCRPTRIWLFEKLQELFEYVYIPKTQPNHEQFPIDWNSPEKHKDIFSRAIFVCSNEKINNDLLSRSLLSQQIRHE